jgi:hypothetical protein
MHFHKCVLGLRAAFKKIPPEFTVLLHVSAFPSSYSAWLFKTEELQIMKQCCEKFLINWNEKIHYR